MLVSAAGGVAEVRCCSSFFFLVFFLRKSFGCFFGGEAFCLVYPRGDGGGGERVGKSIG